MKQVSYIATNSLTPQALQSWFEKTGFVLKELNPSNPDFASELSKADILLLFVPFFHNNVYISTEKIWKKFVIKEFPNLLFLTAGYIKQAHSNYLDLLQLPENFDTFIQQTLATNTDWFPPYSGGLKIEQKLHKFYEGHGDESLVDELGKIYRIICMAMDELTIHNVDYEEIYTQLLLPNKVAEKWGILKNRWQNYLPFFEGLPFYSTFLNLDTIFQDIAPFFEGECRDEQLLLDLSCKEKMILIKQKLEIIGRQYA